MANYTLGRGKAFFDKFVEATKTLTGERYMGNSPSLAMSSESNELEHFSSDEGINEKDDAVTLSIDRSGTLTLDDISKQNLALFFLGEDGILTATLAALQQSDFAGVKQDRYYQVGRTTLVPQGVRDISGVTVQSDAGTPVVYVITTDYTVDLDLGRVYIVPGGGIADDSNIEVLYTRNASTRPTVISSSNPAIEGAFRFVANNPKGADFDHFYPYVRITPNGEYELKGDTWQVMSFNIEVLKLNSTTASHYIDGRPA